MKNALMMRALLFAVTFAVASLPAVSAVPACRFDAIAAGSGKIGQWIDKSNWLAVENQRVSLQAATVFMPAQRLRPATGSPTLRAAVRPLDIDRVEATDPLDGSKRDLAFLLDSRLYADGLVVLHNGRMVVERYRNGLRAGEPRLLLQATRPLLSLLGAVSIGQGKLAGERAVARVIPSLNSHPDLRKLSIQRLLLDHERHAWSAEELDRWRQAAGWSSGPANAGIRSWLAEPGRWDRPLLDHQASTVDGSPDDDLLAWVLAESNATPLAPLFCEQLLSRARPEHPVLWLTDARGVELADGLGLSLRDFARLGQLLLDARASPGRTRIPGWFIETLTASSGSRSVATPGLAKGSEQRYGFTHLGGRSNRVALIGSHGSSLYVDFDRRLVVALYATYPPTGTPALRATLEQFWRAIDQVAIQPRKR
ncbi:MAG: hypothetical protein V5B33_11045 [Candidatus Accumulibacter sp. UW20]|jgi:hypothetical protein